VKKVKILVFDVDAEKRSGMLLQQVLETNAALLEVKLIAEGKISRASKRLSPLSPPFLPTSCFSFSDHGPRLRWRKIDPQALENLSAPKL